MVFLLFIALQSGITQDSKINISTPTEDSISLYLFLLDDCPICINYTPLLNDLYDEYGSQIHFQGYFPNFSSKQSKIDVFRQTYNIEFPLQTDYFKEQAKRWNAAVTPEAILYNHTLEKIIYQGRIDNKFVRLGKKRNVVTKHELVDAIQQTLASEKVLVHYAEPIGCFINYSDSINRKN